MQAIFYLLNRDGSVVKGDSVRKYIKLSYQSFWLKFYIIILFINRLTLYEGWRTELPSFDFLKEGGCSLWTLQKH